MYKTLLMAFSLFSSLSLATGLSRFHSGEAQVNLLELYSSEGCSSCPPADQFVSQLKDQKTLWRDFIPLAFHVDYWDQLGWKDIYARHEFTQRQRDYAELWKSSSTYTPGLVLNGEEWTRWRTVGKRGLEKKDKIVGVLEAQETKPRVFLLKFSPKEALPDTLTLNGALLGSGLASQVRAGENSGVTLHHDF